jgi:hypothetical protein
VAGIDLTINRENANKTLALGNLSPSGKNLTAFLTKKLWRRLSTEINNESLKKIWKEILIQAIHFLRINDCRERAFLKARNGDWDLKNKTNMDVPRTEAAAKLNAYGIEELSKYFDQFTEFEATLYGAENHYRDHVTHPVYVWLLGLRFLDEFAGDFKFRCAKDIRVDPLAKLADPSWPCFLQQREDCCHERPDSCADCRKCSETEGRSRLQVSAAELGAMWTIIALTHDLGYPLEKVERVNDRLEKMLGQFGHIGFARSTFQFASQHDHLVQQLLNIIASNLVQTGKERWRTQIRPKYQAKFSRSWEAFNHGIVSSLILLRTLTYFLETDVTLDKRKRLSNEDARQFAIRSEMLHSIAAHTIEKVYHLSAFTLPFLLVLCDDLQEWGRPTMGDFRAGDLTGSAQEVKVKIEVVNEMTVIECSIKHGKCDYAVQRAHALRAFKTWHERLRPALDDRKRNMSLEWELEFEGCCPWSLTIDTSQDVFQMVNATGPKEKSLMEQEELAIY